MLALLSEVSKTFLLIILKMFSLFQRVLWYHQQRTDWWRCDQCPHHRSSSCLVSRKVWNGPTWQETRKFGLLPTDKKVWTGHTWRDPRKFGLVPLGGIPESLNWSFLAEYQTDWTGPTWRDPIKFGGKFRMCPFCGILESLNWPYMEGSLRVFFQPYQKWSQRLWPDPRTLKSLDGSPECQRTFLGGIPASLEWPQFLWYQKILDWTNLARFWWVYI